jgi:arabinan endo-1,5-alpha-L-arabinosidase
LENYADANTTDNNLFNVGATTPSYVAGYEGQGYNFLGANGVRLPDGIIGSEEFTVSFWMRSTEKRMFSPAFFALTASTRSMDELHSWQCSFHRDLIVMESRC